MTILVLAMGLPDNQGLVDVALSGEGNDVVAPTELSKRVAFWVSFELHAALASFHINNSCRKGG